jgi:hypothetical protein
LSSGKKTICQAKVSEREASVAEPAPSAPMDYANISLLFRRLAKWFVFKILKINYL